MWLQQVVIHEEESQKKIQNIKINNGDVEKTLFFWDKNNDDL